MYIWIFYLRLVGDFTAWTNGTGSTPSISPILVNWMQSNMHFSSGLRILIIINSPVRSVTRIPHVYEHPPSSKPATRIINPRMPHNLSQNVFQNIELETQPLEIAQLEEHPAVIVELSITGRPRVRSAVSRVFLCFVAVPFPSLPIHLLFQMSNEFHVRIQISYSEW